MRSCRQRCLLNCALTGVGMMVAVIPSLVFATAATALAPFDGTTSFPDIHSSSDPEEFSWEVALAEDQQLEAVDDQIARVRYADGHTAFVITAEPAHDVDGSAVPTSLVVSGENVLTLLVHHRAGDPADGGAPFAYPITNGLGWEGGFSTVLIKGPPDEQELREERERIERERSEKPEALNGCVVPRLKGKSLKASKRRLRDAGCRVGRVTRLPRVTAGRGRVVGQSPAPGTMRAHGSVVRVTVGPGS
jgi:PASTA domain-containing protein